MEATTTQSSQSIQQETLCQQSLTQFLCCHLDAYVQGLSEKINSYFNLSVMNDIVKRIDPELNVSMITCMTAVFAKKINRVTNSHETIVNGIRMFFEAMTYRAVRCEVPEVLIRRWLTTGTIVDEFFDQIIADHMGATVGSLIPFGGLVEEIMPGLIDSTKDLNINSPEDLIPHLTEIYQEEYRGLPCVYPSNRFAQETWHIYLKRRDMPIREKISICQNFYFMLDKEHTNEEWKKAIADLFTVGIFTNQEIIQMMTNVTKEDTLIRWRLADHMIRMFAEAVPSK
jgi:hypothetical protein